MDYTQISPRLFVGSCPTGKADIDRLKEAGMTAVVNLQTRSDLAYLQIDWPRLETLYRTAGIEIRRVPIEDFNRDALRQNLSKGVEAVDDLMQNGHTVYVHCSAGVNRSPSVIIAYLHWIEGWGLDEAAHHVMSRRFCDPYLESIALATADRAKEA